MKDGVSHESAESSESEAPGCGGSGDADGVISPVPDDTESEEGARCDSCGQFTSFPRLTFGRLFFDAIRKIIELDSPWMRTIGHVVYRPERVATAYIRGDRKTYVNPAKFCFIAGALTLAALELARGSLVVPQNLGPTESSSQHGLVGTATTGDDGAAVAGEGAEERLEGNPTTLDEESAESDQQETQRLIQEAVQAHARISHIFNFLAIPVLASSLRLMFPKRGFNIAEHSVLGLYIYGEMFLLQMLMIPIGGFSSIVAVAINTAAVVVWSLWAIVRFERAPWFTGLLRAFAATAAMWVFTAVLTSVFVVAFVAYHKLSVL